MSSSLNVILGKAKKPKSEEQTKDEGVVKPKRPLSTYLYFAQETITKLKKDEGMDHKTAFSKAGELWQALPAEKRGKWEKLNADDKKR